MAQIERHAADIDDGEVPGEIFCPINPEFDSSAAFACKTSPDTFTTPTLALEMVKSPSLAL